MNLSFAVLALSVGSTTAWTMSAGTFLLIVFELRGFGMAEQMSIAYGRTVQQIFLPHSTCHKTETRLMTQKKLFSLFIFHCHHVTDHHDSKRNTTITHTTLTHTTHTLTHFLQTHLPAPVAPSSPRLPWPHPSPSPPLPMPTPSPIFLTPTRPSNHTLTLRP